MARASSDRKVQIGSWNESTAREALATCQQQNLSALNIHRAASWPEQQYSNE